MHHVDVTFQLSLIHNASRQPEPDSTPDVVESPQVDTTAPNRSRPSGARKRTRRAGAAGVSSIGRLDRSTISRGRQGVAAARAELQGAAARAAERQRVRAEERLARLEQLNRGHRTAPGSLDCAGTGTGAGNGPDTEPGDRAA